MTTFLESVQDFVAEVGVAGGTGPTSIATGETTTGINRVIQFTREAHDYLCRLWPDWDFLWAEEIGTVTAGAVAAGDMTLPNPSGIEVEDFAVAYGGMQVQEDGRWHNVRYQPWREFKVAHRTGATRPASSKPAFWSFTPNRTIQLSNPVGSEFNYRYEYYGIPARLANDDDEIVIPMPRLVLVRAKIIFAERENAPEIMQGATAEYDDLMTRLESRYLPGHSGGRSNEPMDQVVRDV